LLFIRLGLLFAADENEAEKEELELDELFSRLNRGRNLLRDSNEDGEDLALELRVF